MKQKSHGEAFSARIPLHINDQILIVCSILKTVSKTTTKQNGNFLDILRGRSVVYYPELELSLKIFSGGSCGVFSSLSRDASEAAMFEEDDEAKEWRENAVVDAASALKILIYGTHKNNRIK